MSNNTSTVVTATVSPSTVAISLAQDIPYIFLGLLAISGNIVLCVSIFRDKHLRDKCVLQIALSVADATYGCAYLFAGSLRISYLAAGLTTTFVTRLQCMLHLFVPFYVLGNQLISLLMILIAIDRFCAVRFPMSYYSAPKRKYALVASALVYAYCLASLGLAFVAAGAAGSTVKVAYSCTVADSVGPYYGAYNYGLPTAAGIFAATLSIVTKVQMRLQNRRLEDDAVALQRLRREERFTRTMSIVMAFCFMFFTCPAAGLIVLSVLGNAAVSAVAVPFLGMSFCVHSCMNVFIYLVFNVELRNAFRRTICPGWKPKAVAPAISRTQATSQYVRGTIGGSVMTTRL